MSATRSIISYNLSNPHLGTRNRSQASSFNPCCLLKISTSKHGQSFLANRGLLSCTISRGVNSTNRAKMDMTVRNVLPGVPLPAGPPSSSWKGWLLGILVSVIIPFWRNKWGPLLTLKREVEMVMETVETVTDIIETVAEEVEKVADDVAEKLPEGGKLRDAVCFVEHVAKEAAKDAHIAGDFLDKVEEVEKEVEKELESLIKPGMNQESMVAEENMNKEK